MTDPHGSYFEFSLNLTGFLCMHFTLGMLRNEVKQNNKYEGGHLDEHL